MRTTPGSGESPSDAPIHSTKTSHPRHESVESAAGSPAPGTDRATEISVEPAPGHGHDVSIGQAQGFEHTTRRDGAVGITHHGTVAAVLRGMRAEQFLDEAADDPQGAQARWTGNYKHGNERTAKRHPRNRTRR